MEPELTELLAVAASTVVKQLTTTAWARAKTGLVTLWRHRHPDRADTVEAELDETRTVALAAEQAGDEQAVRDLVDEWRGRLRRLVAADPDLAAELRLWLAEWAPRDADAGPVSMSVRASGHGRVTMAGRDITITG